MPSDSLWSLGACRGRLGTAASLRHPGPSRCTRSPSRIPESGWVSRCIIDGAWNRPGCRRLRGHVQDTLRAGWRTGRRPGAPFRPAGLHAWTACRQADARLQRGPPRTSGRPGLFSRTRPRGSMPPSPGSAAWTETGRHRPEGPGHASAQQPGPDRFPWWWTQQTRTSPLTALRHQGCSSPSAPSGSGQRQPPPQPPPPPPR